MTRIAKRETLRLKRSPNFRYATDLNVGWPAGVLRSTVARKLRVEYAGACYHVINRGNYRRNVFGDAGAPEVFERCLDEACSRFRWLVHAYIVMVIWITSHCWRQRTRSSASGNSNN